MQQVYGRAPMPKCGFNKISRKYREQPLNWGLDNL